MIADTFLRFKGLERSVIIVTELGAAPEECLRGACEGVRGMFEGTASNIA